MSVHNRQVMVLLCVWVCVMKSGCTFTFLMFSHHTNDIHHSKSMLNRPHNPRDKHTQLVPVLHNCKSGTLHMVT